MNWFFLVKEILFGFAVIVDILLLEKKPQKFAQYVLMQNHFLKERLKTTNEN